MQHQLDRTDLAHYQPCAFEPYAVAILRIGDRVVASKLFPARETNLFRAMLHPSKERLKRKMHAIADILQDHTMHQLKRWPFCFPIRKEVDRIIQPQRITFSMGITPRRKHLIVDPAAFFKLLIKDAPLAVRQVYSIVEGFSHAFIIHDFIPESKRYNLKPLKRVKGVYPKAKALGFYALAL